MLSYKDMAWAKKIFFGIFLIAIAASQAQAQENQTNKPPAFDRRPPAASLNVGAAKLKENLSYQIDPNTHIGLGGAGGFKFGLRINF